MPMFGSAVANRWGWRAVLWGNASFAAACEGLFLTFFRETYRVVILRRRAERLAMEHKRLAGPEASKSLRFKTPYHGDDEASVTSSQLRKLGEAILRPMIVLSGSGVLMAMSLLAGTVFTFLYVYNTTLADMLVNVYKIPPEMVGSCYVVFCKSLNSFPSREHDSD